MAKVQPYDRNVLTDMVQPASIGLAGTTARAVGEVAGVAADVSFKIAKDEQVAKENAWLTSATVEAQKRLLDKQDALQQQFGENPEGYSKAMEDAFGKEIQGLADTAPTTNASRAWNQTSGSLLMQNMGRWSSWEKERKVENYTVGLDDSLQKLATVAYRSRDPNAWENFQGQVDSAMEGAKLLLDPKTIAAAKEGAMSTIAKSWWDGIYEQSPTRAKMIAESGKLDSALPPEKISAMVDKANNEIQKRQREVEQRNTLARIEARGQAGDIEAALRSGVDVDVPDGLLATMKPEERDQWTSRLTEAQQFGQDVQAVSYASPEEVNTLITARQEKMTSGDVEGFKTQSRDLSSLSQIMGQRNAAIAKDPAGYAANSPSIGSAKQDFAQVLATQGQDRKAVADAQDKYLSSLVSEQRRLGVPDNMIRYVPKGEAQSMVNQFYSTPDFRERQGLLKNWEENYGRYWPSIAHSLKEEGMPSGFMAVTKMGSGDPMGAQALMALGDAANIKKSVGSMESIAKKVNINMAGVAASYANQPNGLTAYQDLKDGATLLAAKLVSQGEDPDNAAVKAAGAITKNFDLQSTYRIPRASPFTGQTLDTRQIKNNLETVRTEMKLSDVDLPENDEGLRDAQAKSAIEYKLKQQTFWINANANGREDGGYTLMWKSGLPVTKGGRPIVWNIDDVAKVKSTAKPKAGEKPRGGGFFPQG